MTTKVSSERDVLAKKTLAALRKKVFDPQSRWLLALVWMLEEGSPLPMPLVPHAVLSVGSVNQFNAEKYMLENKIFYLDDSEDDSRGNFQKYFLQLSEGNVEKAKVVVYEVVQRTPSKLVQEALKDRVMKLAHFFEFLRQQLPNQSGIEIYAAYVSDANGKTWNVCASMYPCLKWHLWARPLFPKREWLPGLKIVSY